MPDREHEELEKELGEIGSRIEYPPTPDVARTVRRRLDAESMQRRRRRLRSFATPKWAAAAALTLLLSLAALSPAMRSTISGSVLSSGASGGAGEAAGGAGVPRDDSYQYATETQPQPDREDSSGGAAAGSLAAGGSSDGPEAPPGSGLGLGENLSRSEARARVGELLLPETPELTAEPEAIYPAGPSEGDGVVLVFEPEPGLAPLGGTDVGLLLVEVPGDLESVYPTARLSPEEVDVGGQRGYWLPDGRSLRSQPADAESLPGGALMFEQRGIVLLMRADVTKEEAVRIAETIR